MYFIISYIVVIAKLFS